MARVRPFTPRLVLLLPCLTGCATLSESQCLGGDWAGIGHFDALQGYPADRLQLHTRACAEHGVGVDHDRYHAGYVEGLAIFCLPPEAFALGRRGGGYHRQCPGPADRDFLPAHDLGRQVYEVEQDLVRIESEIERLRDEIRDDDSTVTAREDAERQLRYVKDERERRREARDRLLARAREYGYGNAW